MRKTKERGKRRRREREKEEKKEREVGVEKRCRRNVCLFRGKRGTNYRFAACLVAFQTMVRVDGMKA